MFFIILLFFINQFNAQSGSCSDTEGECNWELSNGILTISGNGRMKDYDYSYNPWYNETLRCKIKEIIIKEGITNIGKTAFIELKNVYNVELPTTVTEIGFESFYGCTSLKYIYLPKNLEKLGEGCFMNCVNLVSLTIPTSISSIPNNMCYNCQSLVSISLSKSFALQ